MHDILQLKMDSASVISETVQSCKRAPGYFAIIVRDYENNLDQIHFISSTSIHVWGNYSGSIYYKGCDLECDNIAQGSRPGEIIAQYNNGSKIVFARSDGGFTPDSYATPNVIIIDTLNPRKPIDDILSDVRTMIDISYSVSDTILMYNPESNVLNVDSYSEIFESPKHSDDDLVSEELKEYLDSLGGEAVG